MKESNDTVGLINDLSQAIEEINKADDFDEMEKSVKNKPTIKSYIDKKGKSFAKDTFIGVTKSLKKAKEKINKCARKGRRGDNKIYENCKEELEHIKKKVSESGNRDTILANKEIQEEYENLIEAIQGKVSNFNDVTIVRKKNTIALVKQLNKLQKALKNAQEEGKRVWEPFSEFFEAPIVKKFMKKKPSISGRIIRELFKIHVKYRCTNDAKYIDGVGEFLDTQWLRCNAPFIPKNFINSKEKRVSRTALGEEVLEAVKGVVDELNAFEEHIIVEVESEPEPADSAAPAVAPSASTAKRRKYSVPKTPPPPPPISTDKSASPPPTPARPTVSASSTDTPPAPVPRNSKDSAAPAAPVAPVAPEAPPPPTPARPTVSASSTDTPPAPVPRDSKDSAAPAAPVAPPAPPAPAVSTDSAATSGGSITESTLRRVKLTPPPPKEVADSANPQSGRPTAAAIKIGIGNLRKVNEKQLEADKKAKQRREEEGENPLMRDIRKRPQLKSAAERKLPPKPVVPKDKKGSGSGDLFGTLKNAMFARRKAVASDDDKSDDEHDSEWDDI